MRCPSCGWDNGQNAKICKLCQASLTHGVTGASPRQAGPIVSGPGGGAWQPSPAVASAPAAVPSRGHSIVGTVRHKQEHVEQINFGQQGNETRQVWRFRVELATAGTHTPEFVQVEMRARSFAGAIADGDLVEIEKNGWTSGQLLSPKQVRNLTTRVTVRARGGGVDYPPWLRIPLALLLCSLPWIMLAAVASSGAPGAFVALFVVFGLIWSIVVIHNLWRS